MTASTVTALTAGTYQLDPARSVIRFTTSHGFGLGPVAGTFTLRGGELIVDGDLRRSQVTARVDAASFTTDNPKRDRDIRGKRFLRTDEHPDLVFSSERVTNDGAGWRLHGTLTVCGRTAQVVLDLDDVASEPGRLRFMAHSRIDRHALRIGPRGFLARYLEVSFNILATST